MKDNTESASVWCPHPYKYLMVSPDNLVKPCCRYRSHPDEISWNSEKSPIDIFKGVVFSQIRENMQKGQEIPGCYKCDLEDEQGLKSMRRRVIETRELSVDSDIHLEGMEIGFSRLCNLKCRSCNSYFSTKWEADEKKLGIQTREKPDLQFDWHKLPYESLKNIKNLKITGGEPFLSKNFSQFIHHLTDLDLAKNIRLEVFTNATIRPKPSSVEALSGFKEFNLLMSIDGFGDKNHYLRNPAQWKDIEDVCRIWRYARAANSQKIRLECAITVSLYNVLSIFELLEWCKSLPSLIPATFHIVSEPSWMSLYYVPQTLADRLALAFRRQREEFSSRFQLLESEKRHLLWIEQALEGTENRTQNLDEFFEQTNRLDEIRKESFVKTFPDLAQILETTQ